MVSQKHPRIYETTKKHVVFDKLTQIKPRRILKNRTSTDMSVEKIAYSKRNLGEKWDEISSSL